MLKPRQPMTLGQPASNELRQTIKAAGRNMSAVKRLRVYDAIATSLLSLRLLSGRGSNFQPQTDKLRQVLCTRTRACHNFWPAAASIRSWLPCYTRTASLADFSRVSV